MIVKNALGHLDFYQKPKISNDNSKIIKSVHLRGSTIDNKLIENNTIFGNSIEYLVEKFYNKDNSQDNVLI